jgi:signal transduction histidine kinase
MKLRLLPKTLYGRLVLMLFAAFVGVQVFIAAVILTQVPERVREEMAARDLAIRLRPALQRIAPGAPELTKEEVSLFETLGYSLIAIPSQPQQESHSAKLLEHLSKYLDAKVVQVRVSEPLGVRNFRSPFEEGELGRAVDIVVQARDDLALNYKGRIALPMFAPIGFGMTIDIAMRLLAIAIIALAITRWLVSPLNRLAAQADSLGRNLDAAPISEDGPREIERTAKAFNQMQKRLRNYIDDRTRMLTAISHDLRTPITRVLLRLEMMPPSDARDRSVADLTQLTEMVNETLDFVRGEHRQEAAQTIQLDTLISERVRNANSHAIVFESDDINATVLGRRLALARLFDNLIENALRYATSAKLSCELQQHDVIVNIKDDGPGIPEAELERVFEPFYRVEKSRNVASGGTGLGLAIARDIARAHGGDVQLQNRTEGGLRATVTLPIAHAESFRPT